MQTGWSLKKGMNEFTSRFKFRRGAGFRITALPPTGTVGHDTGVRAGENLINSWYCVVGTGCGVLESSDSVAAKS